MKYSFFMMPLHLPSENPVLAFDRDIDLINYAEELDFDEFYIGEHHTAGWETIPAPDMVLAKASATTHRIKLGTSVVSLPFHHPFEVAERFAFLDHLTRGRAILGVGPSSLPPDIQLYNIPPQDLNPMMRESTEIIVKLLETPGPVTYEGKYWSIKDMMLQLRSYQQPRLKMATASVGSERSLEFAAMHDMILFSLAGGGPPNSVPLNEQWNMVEHHGRRHGKRPSRDDFRVVTYVHLADTHEQAWAEVKEGIVRDVHNYFYTINTPAQWVMQPDQDPASLTAEEIVQKRRWIIGTPEEAIEQIQQLYDAAGGFGGLMIATHEWTDQARIKYSLELFARYVMPHFRGHTADLKRAWQKTIDDRKAGLIPNTSGPPGEAPGVYDHKSNIYVKR